MKPDVHTDIPPGTLAAFGGDELRARVFWEKYALRNEAGAAVERTPEEMWQRVAREIASVETDEVRRSEWERKFYWLLEGFRFIPGGRILHGAGNPRRVTLLNCYTIPIREDSIEAIFDWMKEAARTYSFGGGVGVDLSVLRPKGSPVHNAARTSTGSVSFMELFSLTTGTIGQSGRRGALMITIADNHPDLLDFIRVKRNLVSVRYANISVRVSDAFMQAVSEDGIWNLRFCNERVSLERTVRAREIWDELIRGARDFAEPGVIFWDTVRRGSTSEYNGMNVVTTNPCSEIPLEPYGNCCLGNVNLSAFVLDPFTPGARIGWSTLEMALRYAVRFLDDVLDYNAERHPLPQQREASLRSRRIGVGFTGLGDMLIKLRLKYDTPEAIDFVDRLFGQIKNIVYDESVNLAIEKGTFPAFSTEEHLKSPFIQSLDPGVIERIREHGLRNVALLTVPPVGSGAALAGVSSGIEPVFALSYIRRSESLSQEVFRVYHPLVREYMQRFNIASEEGLPGFFITAHRIRPEMRVRMQATIQRHIDHAISSTINLPREATPEDIERIYFLAWKMGCKGVTVYREGSREGVLITPEEAKRQNAVIALSEKVTDMAAQIVPGLRVDGKSPEEQIEQAVAALVEHARTTPVQLQLTGDVPTLKPRPSILYGVTLPQKAPEGSLQVTVNEVDGEPFELIVHGGKTGSDILAIVQALARAASMLLRLQKLVPPRERLELLIEQWRGIKGSRQLGLGPNAVYSAPDAIARALERYLALRRGQGSGEPGHAAAPLESVPVTTGNMCPRCQQFALITDEGCTKCTECGFREC